MFIIITHVPYNNITPLLIPLFHPPYTLLTFDLREGGGIKISDIFSNINVHATAFIYIKLVASPLEDFNPNITIDLPKAYEKLHCKGESYQFIG